MTEHGSYSAGSCAWLMVSCCQHSVLLLPYSFGCSFHGGGDRCLRFKSRLRASRDLLPASAQQLLPPFHQLGLQAVPAMQEQLTDAMETERAESLWESMVDSIGRARVCRRRGSGLGLF
jgi:hypothetical protein